MTEPKRGEVWLVDLGMSAKVRPCLVISVPIEDTSVLEINLRLAETPCGPMSYASPRKVAPRLLDQVWGRMAVN